MSAIRLAELSPAQRRLVEALLAQKKAGPVTATIGTGQEVRRAAGERSAAA